MNYERVLGQIAPANICRAVGAPLRSTWAEVIAAGMFRRAVLYDTAAAKEIREVTKVTEGRLAISVDIGDQIDYSAGRSAKELLLRKLEPREG
jgi:hypothetical protein